MSCVNNNVQHSIIIITIDSLKIFLNWLSSIYSIKLYINITQLDTTINCNIEINIIKHIISVHIKTKL